MTSAKLEERSEGREEAGDFFLEEAFSDDLVFLVTTFFLNPVSLSA